MTAANGGADPDARPERRWAVALSFAGAQRDCVGQVAAALKAQGVRCLYDADKQVRLRGTHLAEELPGSTRARRWWWWSSPPTMQRGTGPGWNAAPHSAGRLPRPGCAWCPPGSTTASYPGCCPM